MLTLKEAYGHGIKREKEKLEFIKNNSKYNIFSIASGLRANCITKFLYHFYEENNIKKSKQNLYTTQKLLEFMNKLENNKYFPTQLNKLFFLCSDSKEIIANFKNFEINSIPNLDYRIKQGHTLGFVVQQILKCDNEKALYYLDIYETNYKSHILKEYDIEILDAIINEDKNKIEELLKIYLLAKNHNKSSEKGMLSHNLLSYEATVFAKLAWIKGIEINIEHPLLPIELLPINPNENYEIEYDFLKPNYVDIKIHKSKLKKKDGFFERIFKKN
ncbi:Imm49 family immunity protein [Psychroserpens damuponensis]|uniref:Imm49 family immunity protein n=1 Tax=Psychroserpens damuponensis TaxID=943936 RepID=UPI00058CF0F1|nr:Imm49 family immunity protein [Psychroserpens damuponensis]